MSLCQQHTNLPHFNAIMSFVLCPVSLHLTLPHSGSRRIGPLDSWAPGQVCPRTVGPQDPTVWGPTVQGPLRLEPTQCVNPSFTSLLDHFSTHTVISFCPTLTQDPAVAWLSAIAHSYYYVTLSPHTVSVSSYLFKGDFHTVTGRLQSPGFPDPYPHNR